MSLKKKKVTILLLAAAFVTVLTSCASSEYKQANEFFADKQYAEAATIFESLGDYENSIEMVNECAYQSALLDYNEGLYDVALSEFLSLGDYKESTDLIKACKYELGCEAKKIGNWDIAISYFTDLSHEDSDILLKECEREKGMHEKADYAFLAAIEEAILNRRAMNEKDCSLNEIILAELNILKEFSSALFYDTNLKSLANKYIGGLNTQKIALSKEYIEFQIKWQEGLVARYDVLCTLHEDYGLLSDDTEFISNYVAMLDSAREQLSALYDISNDIGVQVNGDSTSVSGYTLKIPYTNNTKYSFDLSFYIVFYKDDVRIDISSAFFSNITSKEECVFECYCPSSWKWNNAVINWVIGF